jgi:muramidase (phage lysozyme)
MLHDYHQMHSAAGGELAPTGRHLQEFFPERFQLWLYRWALDRGHLDTILDRFVADPLMRLSRIFAKLDGIAFGEITKRREEPAISLQVGTGVRRD